MIDPVTKIFLGITAVSAILYFIYRLMTRDPNRTETQTNIISQVKRALAGSPIVKIDDNGEYNVTIKNGNIPALEFTISHNKELVVEEHSFRMRLTDEEYSQFVKIIEANMKIESKMSYPKAVRGSIVNSKLELGLDKFHNTEIKWVKDNIKNYNIIEINNYTWEFNDEKKSFELSKDDGISLEIKQKDELKPKYIVIIKNIDDYFIITEYYNPSSKRSWSRFLVADQFDELQNYIKSL
jgi:hypothetical protein